ncbi:YdcF family protein [Pelomyxa schiedti]|nr:YdcF family protein [Pelomyxa schiedti]
MRTSSALVVGLLAIVVWCAEARVIGQGADCSWVYGNNTDGSAYTDGQPIDVCAENEAAELWYWDSGSTTIIIIPGETLDNVPAHNISEFAKISCKLAVDAFYSMDPTPAVIVVSGGNVHPEGTPYNEAYEMRRYLVETLGFPIDKVVLECYARNSVTNLRNVGRFMLTYSSTISYVICDSPQSLTFINTAKREEEELGYSVGEMKRVDATTFTFVPSPDVMTPSGDSRDP